MDADPVLSGLVRAVWLKAPYGEADMLARAKNTTVDPAGGAGECYAAAKGKVFLVRLRVVPTWEPKVGSDPSVWLCTQQLVHRLQLG